MNQKLPNATTVLVLGIVAILGSCCCNGIVGVICGLIGMNLFNKDNALYQKDPSLYSDYDNLKVGRILCIIGLVIGILSLAYMIFVLSTVGWSGYMDQINQLKNMGK
ncbi:hypothetical protein CEY12_08885 [Chryseobacterium sp. T16E-39]|uniref:CCC motif membrane protein n=1 Tax=Chryseobacterium sp. T16E-39 TaxID=2015076 RepID=UPI000B5B1BFB|nr:CCC motif membrane protein [Chryseobacterium sp. T16E-39]ASK30219.1 hypothetical protein CEY12_08885 [Chryseobacterium sp. T16E-39]